MSSGPVKEEREAALRRTGEPFPGGEEGAEPSYWELLALRRMLEPGMARAACEKASEEDVRRLGELCGRMRKSRRRGADLARLDYAFHREIARISRNSYVEKIWESLQEPYLSAFSETARRGNGGTEADEYEPLLHAFARGDGMAAGRCMQAYMDALMDRCGASSSWKDGPFPAQVEQLRAVIFGNYTRADFSLEESLRAMPFNRDYIRRLFKKEVGATPLEYLTGLRMKKAEELLRGAGGRERPISEVADRCGFRDPLYFSRVFKKYFGCSPSAFSEKE